MGRVVVIEQWRKLACALLLVGIVGVAAELYLLGHFEDPKQWTPLALLAGGGAVTAALLLRSSVALVRALQVVMLAFVASAVVGIYFHLKANVEFELELRPSIGGVDLIMESLKGAMPALSPGVMAQLGLLGLLIAYKHPALTTTSGQAGSSIEGD